MHDKKAQHLRKRDDMNINGMKILSIDENLNNLLIIEEYAKSLSLEVDSYQETQKALFESEKKKYDLVLIDYRMSELNGLEFIKKFRHKNSDIPIIMLTNAEDDVALQEKALKLGAYDCLNKPISAVLFQARVFNALKLYKAQSLLDDESLLLETKLKQATQEVKKNEHESLHVLAKSVTFKEHKTDAHVFRMAHYCKLLAQAADLPEKMQDAVFHASRFYDLGKVAIADEILLKPEKLDDDEYEIIKTHARIGYEMLNRSQSGYLKAAAVISYSHHEKFDGSGYPLGLLGERIPILGRIVAIADVFDALTHARPYKEAWSIEDACQFLLDEKGKHFDPNFVDLFMENLDEIKSIKNKFLDEV